MKFLPVFFIIAFFLSFDVYPQHQTHTRRYSMPVSVDEKKQHVALALVPQGALSPLNEEAKSPISPACGAFDSLLDVNSEFTSSLGKSISSLNLNNLSSEAEVKLTSSASLVPRVSIPKIRILQKVLPPIIITSLAVLFLGDIDRKTRFDPITTTVISAAILKQGAVLAGGLWFFWALKRELSHIIYGEYEEREKRLKIEAEIEKKDIEAKAQHKLDTFKKEVNDKLSAHEKAFQAIVKENEMWVKENRTLLKTTREATGKQLLELQSALEEAQKLKLQDGEMRKILQLAMERIEAFHVQLNNVLIHFNPKPTFAQNMKQLLSNRRKKYPRVNLSVSSTESDDESGYPRPREESKSKLYNQSDSEVAHSSSTASSPQPVG